MDGFFTIQITSAGFYFGAHDDIARYKQLRFEMTPGFAPNRTEDTWPTAEELAGAPAGLTMHWTSYPFLKTGQSFVGPSINLEGHDGDWHQAAAIYRKWFTATHTLNDYRNDWLHQSMAFQDTMFLLPEGNVLWTFKDIPRWARDARKYGVKTVLISGWNVGGHDSNYPLYEPDPRLGTWEELRKSVQKCHEMGTKVFFFVNFQPVDVDTDWYHRELYKYAGGEAYIDPYAKMPGWGMGTLSARLGYTARRLTWVDMAYPEYREIIIRQMVKLAEIGADGLHLDKFLGMGPSGWPGADVSPDQMGAKALKLGLDELLSRCRKVQPHFSLSAEGTLDLGLQWFDVAWGWHYGTHTSVYKYTLPQWMPTMAIVQPWDYNSVNQAMRYGFQFFLRTGLLHKVDGLQTLAASVRVYPRVTKDPRETQRHDFHGGFHRQSGNARRGDRVGTSPMGQFSQSANRQARMCSDEHGKSEHQQNIYAKSGRL